MTDTPTQLRQYILKNINTGEYTSHRGLFTKWEVLTLNHERETEDSPLRWELDEVEDEEPQCSN